MGTTWDPAAAPYFQVSIEAGAAVTDGVSRIRLGHRIELGANRVPAGNWAEWVWDGKRLEVRNDRFRGYPLYYSAGPGAFAVSPSIDALLHVGTDRSLDTDAIAVFLTIGHYAGEDTPFRSIKAMPPAARLTWEAGRLSVASAPPQRPPIGMSREAAVSGLAELTRTAVQRSIPDDEYYQMPLSGGRDSRHILYELVDAGHPPARCVTAFHHPHVWGGDASFAARVAAALGIPHTALSPGPFVGDELNKNHITSYCADEHAWYMSVANVLNGGTSHMYDGLNGSSSFSRHYYRAETRKLVAARSWDALALSLGRKVQGKPRYAQLISAASSERLGAERAAARIRTEFDRHTDSPEPYLDFLFWSRTMRELNLTATVLNHGVSAGYTPFLDPDLVEFAWSVPTEHIDEQFHDDVIGVYFPQANALRYRPKFEPSPSYAFLREVNRDLLRLLRQHSDGSLVDRSALMRRAAIGSVTGDAWFALARRAELTVYLVQLEWIAAGHRAEEIA